MSPLSEQGTNQQEVEAEARFFAALGFTPKELYAAARAGYDDLLGFVESSAFTRLYAEMKQLAPRQRPSFVRDVLLDPTGLQSRGVTVPDGILIQRSSFGDRRPTLFCVKKFLPIRFHVAVQNVNLTFDNPYAEDIPDGDGAWRDPLPVEVQSSVMERGGGLQGLSERLTVGLLDSDPYPNPAVANGCPSSTGN